MDVVDVVKWKTSSEELASKFPSDNLRIGSQLIVYPSQTAFFVKGGKILDEFQEGTYTIKSENIPLIGKILNIPFNGETPFKADVWFVNQIELLDCKWGTSTPIQIEDPKYEVIVPIRAYGQYGFKIVNPRKFLEKLVGNLPSFRSEKIIEYFRGVILSKMTTIIYDKLKEDGLSILNINGKIDELSNFAKEQIKGVFLKYGIEVELFNIISISINEGDPSFQRLKDAKDAAAKIKIIGRGDYQMTRSFDVLEKAAQNNGGGAISTAVGIGAGLNIGNVVGTMAAKTFKTNTQDDVMPPPISATIYHIAVNGILQGAYDKTTIESKIYNGEFADDTLIWKRGMRTWVRISESADFAHLFEENCPPPIPTT